MILRDKHKIRVNFPLRQYFQQLFEAKGYVKFINPVSFWRRYRINHLEACWAINIVQQLEQCYQREWQPGRARAHRGNGAGQDFELRKNSTEIVTEGGLPWKKTAQNAILMPQPRMKLKYRGVIYQTSNL